jgi:hypothetical protein
MVCKRSQILKLKEQRSEIQRRLDFIRDTFEDSLDTAMSFYNQVRAELSELEKKAKRGRELYEKTFAYHIEKFGFQLPTEEQKIQIEFNRILRGKIKNCPSQPNCAKCKQQYAADLKQNYSIWANTGTWAENYARVVEKGNWMVKDFLEKAVKATNRAEDIYARIRANVQRHHAIYNKDVYIHRRRDSRIADGEGGAYMRRRRVIMPQNREFVIITRTDGVRQIKASDVFYRTHFLACENIRSQNRKFGRDKAGRVIDSYSDLFPPNVAAHTEFKTRYQDCLFDDAINLKKACSERRDYIQQAAALPELLPQYAEWAMYAGGNATEEINRIDAEFTEECRKCKYYGCCMMVQMFDIGLYETGGKYERCLSGNPNEWKDCPAGRPRPGMESKCGITDWRDYYDPPLQW